MTKTGPQVQWPGLLPETCPEHHDLVR